MSDGQGKEKYIVQKRLPDFMHGFSTPEQKLLAMYVYEKIKKGKELENEGKLPKRKLKLDKAVLMELCRGKKEIQTPEDLHVILKELTLRGLIKFEEAMKEHYVGRTPSDKIKLTSRWYDLICFAKYLEAKQYLMQEESEPERCRIVKFKAAGKIKILLQE